MAKRVSAGTITGITSSSDFHDASRRPQEPTRDELIAQIRKSLQQKLERREQVLITNPTIEGGEVAIERVKLEIKNFEESIAHVPDGFELVPVLYSKIQKEVNESILAEYSHHVRPRFLMFIAEKYPHELKALGVADVGIARMLKGLDPTDEKGNYYEISIDHIIERSGSGKWSVGKTIDPEQPSYASPKYLPNHFGNLVFLPDQIHQYKNRLNDLQETGSLVPGESKWILMMTPIADGARSGYVAQPQDPASPLHGMRFRPDNAAARMSRAIFSLDQAREELEAFSYNPIVARMLNSCANQARLCRMTVHQVANDNKILKNTTLRKAFNAAVNENADAKSHAEKVKPALIESMESLKKAYEACATNTETSKGRAEIKSLAKFFGGASVQKFRENIEHYPTDEAMELARFMNDLEKKLKPYMPGNENCPPLSAGKANQDRHRGGQGPKRR